MRVSIVGTGYVGLVTGVGLAHVGHDVICVDIDEQKVVQINRGLAPIFEEGLEERLREIVGIRLRATTDLVSAVHNSDLTIVAVGTPFDGESIDLRYVRDAACGIGGALRSKDSYHLVVVKSTVVPGTTATVVLPIVEQASGKRAGRDFGIAMNPEFLAEGTAIADFFEPDRIVVGGIDERSRDMLAALFEPFRTTPVLRTDTTTAEMIKYTANAMFATMISFSNEMGNLCARLGIDVVDVMRGVHLDRRLSPLASDGSRLRPGVLAYLAAGCGFGGSCFPKDVKALAAFGRQAGDTMQLMDAVVAINAQQPMRMVELLRRRIPELRGIKVAVLGMAFKPGTDDIRESPAIPVTQALLAEGALVSVFDPIATGAVRQLFGDAVDLPATLADTIYGVDAILLMTSWQEFEAVPALLAQWDQQSAVVDGRRMLSKHDVAVYEGIGLSKMVEAT